MARFEDLGQFMGIFCEILFLTCFIAACFPVLLLYTLKSSFPVTEEKEKCSGFGRPLSLMTSGIDPFLEEIVCGPDVHCNSEDQIFPPYLFPPITERIPNDDKLLDFMKENNPASIHRKLTKNLAQLEKFVRKLERQPTLNDAINTPYQLNTSVNDYERLLLVTEERLNINLTEATEVVLLKLNLKQILSGIPKNLSNYFIFDARTLGKFVALSDDLTFRLNNLTSSKYDLLKSFYNVVYDHLDWRKIYQKVNQLRTYSMETQFTPKHIKSLHAMIESFSQLEKLRSLLGIFYSAKLSLETFADARKTLNDTGWNDKEISELVTYFLELNEEGILEKHFQFSKGKVSKKKESNVKGSLIFTLLRSIRNNLLENNCSYSQQGSAASESIHFLTFMMAIKNLFYELSLESIPFSDIAPKLKLALDVVELIQNDKIQLAEECEIRPLLVDISRNLNSLDFGKVIYGVMDFIIEFPEQDLEEFAQIFRRFGKALFSSQRVLGSNEENPVLRIQTLAGHIASFWDQLLTSTRNIFPESLSDDEEENLYLKRLIAHPLLLLTPSNSLQIIGDLITTEIINHFLPKKKLDESCHVDSSEFDSDLKCSIKNGVGQKFTSPFFAELLKVKALPESPNMVTVIKKFFQTFRFIQKCNKIEKIPLLEIKQFLEIWSSKSQWEILEENLNSYHQTWIYSFLDSFIPLWNESIAKMLSKLSDWALYVQLFIEEVNKFLESDQVVSDVLNNFNNLNGTWEMGLLIIYDHIRDQGESLRYDDICEIGAKIAPVENLTLDEFEEIMEDICSVDLKAVSDAVRQFDKNFDRKFREMAVSTGTFHLKSLVDSSHKAYEDWLILKKIWSDGKAKKLLQLLFNTSHEILMTEEQESSVKTNINFVHTLFELLQIDNFSSKVQKKLSPEFLHKTNLLRQLFATNAEDLLQGTPELYNFQDVILNVIPRAMRESVVFISTKPRMVSILHPLFLRNVSACDVNLALIGENTEKVQSYFCNFPTDTLTFEIEKLMSINSFKKSYIEKSNPAILKLLNQTMLNLQKKQETSLNGGEELNNGAIKIFNFSNWNKIFDTILNVSVDDMYDNGALIWAQTMLPLVTESRSEKPKSEKLREILLFFDGFLREVKLCLGILAGGDLWTSFKNSYEDKNKIIQLIDYIEKSPQIVTHILEYHGDHPTFLFELLQLNDFQSFCSLLSKLAEEGNFDQPDQWKEFLDFFCTQESRDIVFNQLNPKTPPMIGNQTVIDSDAAVLGLLLDGVSWDLFLLQRKYFFEGNIQVPDWIRPFHWIKAKELFNNIMKRGLYDHLALSLLLKENYNIGGNEKGSAGLSDNSPKFKKIGEIIGQWINELEGSNETVSTMQNVNLDNVLNLVVLMAGSEVMHQYLIGDSMEDILKYTCHKSNLSNASLFVCSLIRVGYFDLYEVPDEETNYDRREPTIYLNLRDGIHKVLTDSLNLNDSHFAVQERVYKVFKVVIFLQQQLYVSSCHDTDKCIFHIKLVTQIMNYIIDVDTVQYTSDNSSLEIVEDAINKILKPIVTKKKGGKWANSGEELLHRSQDFFQLFDKFVTSFVNLVKNSLSRLATESFSPKQIKLLGFLEVFAESIWRFNSDINLRNLMMEFSYEIEANSKALSFLNEIVSTKLAEAAVDKSGFQFIQQFLRQDSPIKVIRNSSEELDSIVTALLFFNEAVDSALFNELVSASFLISKISEGKLFVLRSLSESSLQMLRLSKEFIPESTLHKNLLKIQNGLDILLHKKETPETIKKTVFKDMIHNEIELKRKLRTLQIPDSLISGLLSAEVDLNMFQVIIDKWYHTVSTTCEQLTTTKNLNKTVAKHVTNNNNSNAADICSKLRNVDFPLILLSQLNLSSIFYQIENFTLNELFNASKEAHSTFQDAYSHLSNLSEYLKQIRSILFSLTKIAGVMRSSSNKSEITDETSILRNFRKQMCFTNESTLIHENDGDDLCSKLFTKSSGDVQKRGESLLKGKIVISPENHLTRSLVNLMRKNYGGNVERTLGLLKHLKHHLKEECKLSLKKPLLNLPSEIPLHKWAQIPVESVLSVDLNQMKVMSEGMLQFCNDIGLRKHEFEKGINFLLNFTSCFRNDRFDLASREDFERKIEEMTRENRLLAGIDFNQIKKGTLESDSDKTKYNLWLPSIRNMSSSDIKKKRNLRNSFEVADNSRSIQKEVSVIQFMVESSLRKLFMNDNKTFMEQKKITPKNHSLIAANSQDFNRSRITKRDSKIQHLSEVGFPVYAYGTSYECYSPNVQYFDSVIDSSVVGIFVCSSAFALFGIFLINVFVEESRSISPELKRVYSINYVGSTIFPMAFAGLSLIILMCLLAVLHKMLNVLPHTSVLVTMALNFVFGINLIVLSHILSALFCSKISSVVSFGAFMTVMALPYPLLFVQGGSPSHLALIMMNILPPCGFCYGLRSLYQYELLGIGASFSNLWILPTYTNEISLALGLLIQLFGFFIFCLIDLLVVLIFKRDNAADSGDQFLSFKIGHQNVQRETTSRMTNSNETFPIFQDQSHPRVSVHPTLSGSFVRTLKVVGLQKLIFQDNKTIIIGENISFETYENQIFVLFGPAKSGKTTVISMVAGVIQPSSGHICIYEDTQSASRNHLRKTISFCPKTTELPTLVTVKECLMFFGYIKAIKNFKKVQEEVDRLIIELKLESWQHVLLRDVPNVIQRFVAVATALIGGSKIIVLDDPTHQIPHLFKRNLMKVLSNYRKERTILLATGDPEVVEQLADVISVIDKGKLLFIGSNKGLMEEYSPGYDVIINNRQDVRPIPQQEEFEELLEELFQEYFPNSSFMDFDNEEQEIKFNIPYLMAQLHPESFCFLLRDLEMRREELGVSYVEVTHPTMSTVLKAVLQQGDTFRQEALLTPEREEIHKRNFSFKNLTEPSRFLWRTSTFGALLKKRMLHNIRNKFFYLQSILIPVLFIILSMHCLWIPPDEDSQRGLETSSSYINQGIYLLPSNSSSWTKEHESRLEDLLLKSEDTGEDETSPVEKCRKDKVRTNVLLKNKLSCNGATEMLNYTSCICKDKRCLMKIVKLDNRRIFIPFNKRHFRVLPTIIVYEDALSINQQNIVLYFDVDDVISLPSMVNRISTVREVEGNFPNSSQNLNFVSSFDFVLEDNANGDNFSLVHLLATTLFSLLLLTALTLGVVSSSMQMLGEKSQLSVMRAAGVSKFIYITSFIVWDSLVILMISFFTVTIAAIYYEPHLVAGTHLSALLLLSCFYGSSMLPVSYILQGFLQVETLAVKRLCFCSIFTAVLASALIYFCNEYSEVKAISIAGHYLHRIFFSLPPYVFVSGVKSIYFIYSKNQDQISSGKETYYSPFTWNTSTDLHIGVHLIVLSVWICSGYVIILFLNFKNDIWDFWKKKFVCNNQNSEDGFTSVTSLYVSNLTYDLKGPTNKRVELNFNALKGECLMIYGENPLENTMILRHLTGELTPLSGSVKRLPAEVTNDESGRQGDLSYGPSKPALDELLTTEEELQIFSQLRGFYSNDLCEIVHRALCTFNLISVKNFKIKDLSKETRRRICLAKVAIGNPNIIILDDPFRDSSLKFTKLTQELIRNAVSAFDSVIISSSNLDDMNELTKQIIFYEDGRIIQKGKMDELQSSLKREYLVKIQTEKLEDVKAIIRILEGVVTLQITEIFHTTIEGKFSCDVSPFSIFGAIARARGLAPLWYEVSSLTLSQYRRSIVGPAISREPSPEAEMVVPTSLQILRNGNVSSPDMALPVFEGRESRDSFYDNQNDDDLIQPSKFNLSPRIRRGSHGSAKLTPCSTPLPPRSPAGYRTSVEKLSPSDLRRSADRRSSTERSVTTCESSFFKLQKPMKIKRRAGLPMNSEGNSCSYNSSFDSKEPKSLPEKGSRTPSLGAPETTGSQLLMEKFLENLPTVKATVIQSEPKGSSPNIRNEEEHRTKF